MNTRIIIHIGAGKCGSSSLQSALSAMPLQKSRDGRQYEYVAMNRGMLLRGNKISEQARKSPFGYCAFPLAGGNGDNIHAVLSAANSIQKMVNHEGVVPILSCEGWINEASVFTEQRILEEYGGGAKIIMYIRPPVDWLNSAYWQWGAWTDASFNRWFNRSKGAIFWHKYAEQWSEVPGVSEVNVRLATKDVVEDFLVRYLKAKSGHRMTRANTGTPNHFLRFLQRNRELRPDPHSPQIEFKLADFFSSLKYNSAPWVIGPEQQEKIFSLLGTQYHQLKKFMDDEDWKAMHGDSRWWSAESYRERVVENPEPSYDIADADRLIDNLINYILSNKDM